MDGVDEWPLAGWLDTSKNREISTSINEYPLTYYTYLLRLVVGCFFPLQNNPTNRRNRMYTWTTNTNQRLDVKGRIKLYSITSIRWMFCFNSGTTPRKDVIGCEFKRKSPTNRRSRMSKFTSYYVYSWDVSFPFQNHPTNRR